MTLEKIVRPFQSRQVLTTRRIVKSASVPDNATAILTWGAAGNVPQGVLQENKGRDLMVAGFNMRCNPVKWQQSGTPTTEEVPIPDKDGNEVGIAKRVREISFKTTEQRSTDSNSLSSNGIVSGVRDVIEGLRRDIAANRSCEASYKTNWD